MKSFGYNLKFYRLMKNISQKKLGEMVGFSARTISDWEANKTEPDIVTIKKLVEVLNVTLDDLFDF